MDIVGLLFTALAVIGVAGLVVAIALSPRPGAPSGATTVRLAGWVGAALATVYAVAAVYAVATALWAPAVGITIPVQGFWPALPEGTTYAGTTATREQGGFTTAEVTLRGLSMGVRVAWAISQALWCLIPGTVAALVAVMAFRVRRSAPFASMLARFTLTTAVVVALGGLAAQIAGDLAGIGAAEQLLRWTSADYPDIAAFPDADLSTWLPRPGSTVAFPFWPIAAGLGLAALAALFRHGDRLQRETEGLV